MTKHTLYTYISEYFQIALGILLASIGLKAFLLPNDFLDGGVTGTAILVNSQFDSVDISTFLVLLNIPFLILAYFTLSKRILVKSVFSIIGLAMAIHYAEFPTITEDKLLIAIFGGLFVGSGIGLTVKNGAVLDGSDSHQANGVVIQPAELFSEERKKARKGYGQAQHGQCGSAYV